MQLKKDETPEGTGKLVNSAFFTDPDQVVDPAKKRYTDDYSRSSSNTGYVGTAAPDWVEGVERNSFRVTEEEAAKALAPTAKQQRERNAKFLRISEFVMYGFFLIFIIWLAFASLRDGVDIIPAVHNIPVVMIILEAYIIFDSILAYNLGEKKIGLFIFAVLLGIFYPSYRNKVLALNGFGIACTILTIFACVMFGVNCGRAYGSYGAVLLIDSEHTRHEIVSLYEQTGDNGHKIGPYLTRRLTVEDATTDTDKGVSTLTLTGKGYIYLDNLGAAENDDEPINTTLIFTKTPDEPQYKLTGATLNDKELTDNMLSQYWNIIQKGM